MNDIYSLETKAATWAWKKLSAPTAEPRAFHASVLLDDGNILHTFGMCTPLFPFIPPLSPLSPAPPSARTLGNASFFY